MMSIADAPMITTKIVTTIGVQDRTGKNIINPSPPGGGEATLLLVTLKH